VTTDVRAARNAALCMSVIAVAAGLTGIITFPGRLPTPLLVLRSAQVALGALFVLALLVAGRRMSRGAATIAFLCPALLQLGAHWLVGPALVAAEVPWEPLWRPKIAMLILGVFAFRPVWLSELLIALFAGEVALQYWTGPLRTHLQAIPEEPWVTFAFALAGGWLAWMRVRQLAAERALEAARREFELRTQLSRVALAVRDLANTPLQVLELELALLDKRAPPGKELAAIRRAVERLAALNRRLAAFDPPDGKPGAAFDAKRVLDEAQIQR
jgi:hypothetical protein